MVIYGLMVCQIAVERNSIRYYELVNDAPLRRNMAVQLIRYDIIHAFDGYECKSTFKGYQTFAGYEASNFNTQDTLNVQGYTKDYNRLYFKSYIQGYTTVRTTTGYTGLH